jgi:hypothetical protein
MEKKTIKDRIKGFFKKSKLKEEDKNALEYENRTEDGMKRILNNGICNYWKPTIFIFL